MSDDLREQIAQALIRERQRRLAGVSMDSALADADAVLAVVQPVIEQAERERDEAARFGESTQDWLRARVVTLGAALDRIAHHPITQSSDAVTLRQIARDALDEQDTQWGLVGAWQPRAY